MQLGCYKKTGTEPTHSFKLQVQLCVRQYFITHLKRQRHMERKKKEITLLYCILVTHFNVTMILH